MTIPNNWAGFNLADWTTVYPQGAFSGDIPWVEAKNDVSFNKMRLAGEQLSSAEMCFYTDWSMFQSYDKFRTLAISVLGGFNPATNKMVPPMRWKIGAYLFATDLEVQPLFTDNTVQDQTGTAAKYRIALCRVSFQALPYAVIGDPGTSPPTSGHIPLWLEIKSFANNDRVNAPAGYLVYGANQFGPNTINPGVTVPTGTLWTQGCTYVQIIAHRIPVGYANSTTQYIESVIARQGAFCNSDTFIGCEPETLLIDSVQQAPFSDWTGQKLYDVQVNLLYRPTLQGGGTMTWNMLRAPDGGVYNVRLNDGGAGVKQYTPTSFTTLFQFQGLLT